MSLFARLKQAAGPVWTDYTRHEFVRMMGEGTLPEAAFRRYLVQDYLFLIQFARANALAVYKSRTPADMRGAKASLSAILDVEMDLHIRLCARWGLSPADLEASREEPETIAYTRFVLDCGAAGDLLDLLVALAPCVIGYAEIGRALLPGHPETLAAHPYAEWIGEYGGAAYQRVAAGAEQRLDGLAARFMTEARLPELSATFASAARLEAEFWTMALRV